MENELHKSILNITTTISVKYIDRYFKFLINVRISHSLAKFAKQNLKFQRQAEYFNFLWKIQKRKNERYTAH